MALVLKYPISKIVLFGLRAKDTNHNNSDINLCFEFYEPITLLTLSRIKMELEDLLGLSVDVIHGPLAEINLITVEQQVVLYVS